MKLLEKLGKKLKKWEPTPRKVVQNRVSIGAKGIDILSWAASYFREYKGVDLYFNDERSSLGIKPVSSGQRRLSPKRNSKGFLITCTPLMRQIGVNERRRVPAEWSEKWKMLIVDLKGYLRKKPSR